MNVVSPTVPDTRTIEVLDHGFVRLDESMASDLSVVNAARVSFARRKEEMDDSDRGLIRFLLRERHGTPFEHNAFRFHVRAPIFIAREWFRHRVGSFNEFSMRYAKATDDFYVPDADDVRTQVGKPGSYSFEPVDAELAESTREELRAVYDAAYAAYERLVEQGVARELARAVMPVGSYTEFYWTVNARSLMNFVSLRAAETAQREIRRYADACEQFLAAEMPVTYEAFVDAEPRRALDLWDLGREQRRGRVGSRAERDVPGVEVAELVRDRHTHRRLALADGEIAAGRGPLAVLLEPERVELVVGVLRKAGDLEDQLDVPAVGIALTDLDDRCGRRGLRGWLKLDCVVRAELVGRPAPDAEGGYRDERSEGDRDREPPPRGPAALERNSRDGLCERGGDVVRGRRDAAQHAVDAAELLELLRRQVAADELSQVHGLLHALTSSSRPDRRASPVRVRVFTVPRGTSR